MTESSREGKAIWTELQKGNIAEVFANNKERFGEEKVRRWRAALTEAANLSGWDLQNDAHR